MIYVVWAVILCFLILYATLYFFPSQNLSIKKDKTKPTKVDVAYLERLLQHGVVSPYCTHKDVEVLKRHGLFVTLPLIKLFSPSEEELAECVRLQEKYDFTTYVVDSKLDKKKFLGKFVFLSTSETSPNILFVLNRLKLVEQDPQICKPLPKNCYRKTVCQGLKYIFDIKERLQEKKYSISEFLPMQKRCYFCIRTQGNQATLENLYDGSCCYVWSNKKIEIKYEKIMQKLIFNISKNQLNNNLIIFISNKKINNLNNKSKLTFSWSTTNESLNKKIGLALEASDQSYYRKFGFVLEGEVRTNFSSIQEFLLYAKSGEIDGICAKKLFLEEFLGVKIFGDRVSFSKPKLCEDYVLSIDHDGKKYLITRKQTNSNICEICIDGVRYRNFTSFCLREIEKPEIFVEY